MVCADRCVRLQGGDMPGASGGVRLQVYREVVAYAQSPKELVPSWVIHNLSRYGQCAAMIELKLVTGTEVKIADAKSVILIIYRTVRPHAGSNAEVYGREGEVISHLKVGGEGRSPIEATTIERAFEGLIDD